MHEYALYCTYLCTNDHLLQKEILLLCDDIFRAKPEKTEGQGQGYHRTQQGQIFTDISVCASSYHSLEPSKLYNLELNLTTVFSREY